MNANPVTRAEVVDSALVAVSTRLVEVANEIAATVNPVNEPARFAEILAGLAATLRLAHNYSNEKATRPVGVERRLGNRRGTADVAAIARAVDQVGQRERRRRGKDRRVTP